MTCKKCACFDVCDKCKQMCKQLVFGNIGQVIEMGLLSAVVQGCKTFTPMKRNKAEKYIEGKQQYLL